MAADDVNGVLAHIGLYLDDPANNPINAERGEELSLLLQKSQYLLTGLLDTASAEDKNFIQEVTPESTLSEVYDVLWRLCLQNYNHPGRASARLREFRTRALPWSQLVTDSRPVVLARDTRKEIKARADEASDLAQERPASGFSILWEFTLSLCEELKSGTSTPARTVSFDVPVDEHLGTDALEARIRELEDHLATARQGFVREQARLLEGKQQEADRRILLAEQLEKAHKQRAAAAEEAETQRIRGDSLDEVIENLAEDSAKFLSAAAKLDELGYEEDETYGWILKDDDTSPAFAHADPAEQRLSEEKARVTRGLTPAEESLVRNLARDDSPVPKK